MGKASEQTIPVGIRDVSGRDERLGFLLVFLSALFWSFGGAIARFIEAPDSWTVVFWRSVWAAVFLIGFMLWRDGWRGTLRLFRDMGLPGLAVAVCFATASTSFVVALAYTTVANILLMQAGVPLIAALLAWLLFRESVAPAHLGGDRRRHLPASPSWSRNRFDGAGLADRRRAGAADRRRLFDRHRHHPPLRACAHDAGDLPRHHHRRGFRRHAGHALAVSARDMAFLFAFGALNLGLGLACFATGARLIPAAFAALLGTFETLLGPVWVWLIHGEVPSARTIVGGAVVFAALLVHIGLEFQRQSRPASGRASPACRRRN